MTHRAGRRVRWGWRRWGWRQWLTLSVALLLGALALPACGVPPAPPTAASILRQAQTAKITDLHFTATGTFASSLAALLGGQSADGSTFTFQAAVTGTLTTAPRRAELALLVGQEQGVALQIITDAATQTGYVRLPALAPVGLGPNWWIHVPLDGLATYLDPSLFTNFEQLSQPTLVGAETIRGIAVYHLHGAQQLASGIGSTTEDFYVRQEGAYPVRVGIHGAVTVPTPASDTTGAGGRPAASVQVTIDFTSVNSGLTIALPPSSQVVGE